MASNTTPLTVKTATQLASDIRRTIKNGLIENGISSNPNVGESSDFGLIAKGLSIEVAVALNNGVIEAEARMPDAAVGDDLDRLLTISGLVRRKASSAIGSAIVQANSSSLVPTGAQLQSPDGIKYAVTIGGIFGNLASVKIRSVDAGSTTNQEAGTTLTWVSPPAFFSPTATVSAIDVVKGGVDAEDDETARTRLLDHLAHAPGAGNASQLIEFAQASDPAVKTAFVHCAARGPSTVDIVVVGYATSSSKNRDIDRTLFLNTITPYIQGQLPQYIDGYISNVTNRPIDISVALSLPDPITSIPSGPGGGWLDPNPLQVTTAVPALRVVDGYALSSNNAAIPQNTATSFWVHLPIAPGTGVSYNISYLSPVSWTLYNAQTSGVYARFVDYDIGLGGLHDSLYYVTTNTPFYQNAASSQIIQPGNWIFPTAVHTDNYVQAFLDYAATWGPGERVSIAGLLPRANRTPRETFEGNSRLNTRIIKQISNSGEEVYDGAKLFIGDAGTTDGAFADYAVGIGDGDPAYALYAPPTVYVKKGTMVADSFIFTPNQFGLYKQ